MFREASTWWTQFCFTAMLSLAANVEKENIYKRNGRFYNPDLSYDSHIVEPPKNTDFDALIQNAVKPSKAMMVKQWTV